MTVDRAARLVMARCRWRPTVLRCR